MTLGKNGELKAEIRNVKNKDQLGTFEFTVSFWITVVRVFRVDEAKIHFLPSDGRSGCCA